MLHSSIFKFETFPIKGVGIYILLLLVLLFGNVLSLTPMHKPWREEEDVYGTHSGMDSPECFLPSKLNHCY